MHSNACRPIILFSVTLLDNPTQGLVPLLGGGGRFLKNGTDLKLDLKFSVVLEHSTLNMGLL